MLGAMRGTGARGGAARRLLSTLGVLTVAAIAVFGGDPVGVRDKLLGSVLPSPRPVAVSAFQPVNSGARAERTVLRSQPWWQQVARFSSGERASTLAFGIAADTIQWRARWSCAGGRLVGRLAGRKAPLIAASCPDSGVALATSSGRMRLLLSAGGAWRLAVDQQVDVPLVEPPPAALSAPGTRIVAAGALQRIDQFAAGRVSVYRLASGRYVMRFADFYVTPNVDLEIRLSPLRSPRSTRQYLGAPSAYVAPLDITAGSLNFQLPPNVDPTAYHSVVIWCPLITSAYAEAPLSPLR
ncbi:MAG: DM13 domain-containing protein [Solirubrobacteraceae bacterium]